MITIKNHLQLTSHSPDQTQRLGSELGRIAQPGDVFLLVGNLGSGKTCLTQGIAWGLDVKEYATSPTFVIIREYHGRLPLYHIDLYRLDRIEELAELGLEDYLYGSGICAVEWADKALPMLPKEHLLIKLEFLDDTSRSLRLKPSGSRYLQVLTELQQRTKRWKLL